MLVANKYSEIVDEHPQDAAVVPELKPDEPDKLDAEGKRLILLCKSFQKLRKTMTTTFPLPSGGNLEDCLAKYIEELSHVDPAHAFIVDKKMLSTLPTGDKQQVLSQLQPLPAFPEGLEKVLAKYKKVPTPLPFTKTLDSPHDRSLHLLNAEKLVERLLSHVKTKTYTGSPGSLSKC